MWSGLSEASALVPVAIGLLGAATAIGVIGFIVHTVLGAINGSD